MAVDNDDSDQGNGLAGLREMLGAGGGALAALPTLFQSEEFGLTTIAPAGYAAMEAYRRATDHGYSQPQSKQKFDFSQLPQGGAGVAEALKKLVGHDVSPAQIANARAFLDTLAFSEGTSIIGYKANKGQGYDVLVGGGIFSDFRDHPRQTIQLNASLASSAAGRYQFLASTWDDCRTNLGLKDFSPTSQDAAALYLIQRAGGLNDVLAGNFDSGVSRVRGIWASLPGAGYGQHEYDLQTLRQAYARAGGLTGAETVVADNNAAAASKLPASGNGRSQLKAMDPSIVVADNSATQNATTLPPAGKPNAPKAHTPI